MEQDSRSQESRERRAASSEPSSTRPNPFDDGNDSARKRRRTSMAGSRSRSPDLLPPQSDPRTQDAASNDAIMTINTPEPELPEPAPSTPVPSDPPAESSPAEPHSSKVTINLRNINKGEDGQAPPSPTPGQVPSEEVKLSVEPSEMESGLPVPAGEDVESCPSSPSAITSSDDLDVGLIEGEEEEDDDDDVELIRVQPLSAQREINSCLEQFPYHNSANSLCDTIHRILEFFKQPAQYDEVLYLTSTWILTYLDISTSHVEAAQAAAMAVRSREDVRLFWQTMPELIMVIYSRSRNVLVKNPALRDLYTRLFQTLPQLAAHMIKLDFLLVADPLFPDFELFSPGLLECLAVITSPPEPYSAQNNVQLVDARPDRSELLSMFQDEILRQHGAEFRDHSMALLAQLVNMISNHPARQPRKSMEYFNQVCALGESITRDCEVRRNSLADAANDPSLRSPRNKASAFMIFQTVSASLGDVVDNSANHFATELVSPMMMNLGILLQVSLMGPSRRSTETISTYRSAHPAASTLPDSYIVDALVNRWRFRQFCKMIKSRQMQLRVVSITSLSEHLIMEWRRSIEPYRDDTIKEYLGLLSYELTATGLIEYLLGSTCHPEIILAAYNIVGFLAVTDTYESQHTDLFWQTVTTTQDPRISEALVKMMATTIGHFSRDPLGYLIEKMQGLPAAAFNPQMRELSEMVIKNMTQKPTNLIPTFAKLCLRLVQEASIMNAQGTSDHLDVFEFAATKLMELLHIDTSEVLRIQLKEECLHDISLRSPSTSGSLHVLFRVIRPVLDRELAALVAEHEFPRLLAEEFEATIANARKCGTHLVYATTLGVARRCLIEQTIARHGSSVEAQHVEMFWHLMVGEKALSQTDRVVGWQSLNSAQKDTTSENTFLRLCLQEHLPSLPPHLYCPGTLQFLREALTPLADNATETTLDGEHESDDGPLGLLWQIILTAHPRTIEKDAINILVNDIYVKGHGIKSFPPDRARKVHLALVERCFGQMATAAKELVRNNDEVVMTTGDQTLVDHELRFTRSLFVLREFVAVMHHGSHHFAAPDLRSLMLQSPGNVEGESAELIVQSFDGAQQTDMKPLSIGRQNTAASLLASIREATGFNNYRIFYRGQQLTPREDQICKSLEDLKIHNGLLLVKKESDIMSAPSNIKPGASPLEIEILSHFKALWNYLSMEEDIAKEVYLFLVKLPADASILEAFENPDTSHLDVFPLGEPFKCLYTVHALREHLNTRRLRSLVRTNATDTGSTGATGQQETHLKTMSLVVAAIEDTSVIGRCRTEALQIELSQHLLDAFLQLLTESAAEHMVDQFLTKELQERLVTLLLEASAVQHSHHAVEVINCALHALLECCSLSIPFWEMFRHNPSTKRIVQDLLRDHRLSVRKSTGKLIKAKCTFTQAGSHTPALEFAETFWPFAFELLPQVATGPLPSEEIFTLLSLLMHKLYQEKSAALHIEACVAQLLELILNHTSTEDISNPNQVDLVANGLLTLLHYGIKHFSDSEGRGIQFAPGVVRRLFYKHLFPKIGNRDRLVPRVIFSQENRTLLFTILHLLIKDDSNQQEVMLTALAGLVPYNSRDTENSPYLYDLPQGFDRLRAVRAPGGHAGLRNLSNTCYLNSLFTQLFMNVHFRKFMLQVPVADSRGHELLFHTQELFAELQDSIRRSIDPSSCVAQIMNYEETPIDIHTQMDVDEFYNLLFDRWESQMPNTRAKMRMRSFYGGQLVQQVKSKECEHISERIEPFSAIQCDIKGISSLQESLQTYVDGEIMEGDNKYKCEKCNRHVDAVKRACLKEIPDHLIFHLKRFSFDLRTLQRNKINDHFDFPAEIDLSPFTVEHLSDASNQTTPDVFELVGVLVHAGTAESGHYYSYIRERPTSDGTQPWFEFNDETVSPWDPANLAGSCFGGRDATSRFDGGLGFDKAYSAYMLFYQRASSLKQDHVDLRDSGRSHPVRVDVDPVTLDSIKEDNWNIVHRYCTNDESLSRFRQLLLLRTLGHQVPHEHGAKNLAMEVALGHLDQISARAKDTPDFLPLFSKIRQACEECADCSLHFFRYFQHRPEALRMLLMRNLDPNIRQSMGDLLIYVLKTIKNQLPEEYHPQDVDPDDQALDVHEAQPSALRAVVCLFNILWDTFQTSLRAWPELFGTMVQFASISNIEGGALLEEDYLLKLFMVLIADVTDQALPPQYIRLATTLFKRQRPPSFDAIIQLVDILMSYLQPDLADQDFPETTQGRLALALKGQKLSYTSGEINQLHASFPRMRYSILVDKLIQLNQNLTSTESIVKRLLDLDPMMDSKVFTTLVDGLNNCQQDIPLIPVYLQGIVFYIRWSRNAESVQYLMKLVVSTCKTVTSAEGTGFLSFFRTTHSMTRETEPNETIVESRSLEDLPIWAPVLLGSTDSNVRSDMDLFLKQTLWAWLDNYKLQGGVEDDDLDDSMHDRVKCVKRLTIYCLKYLHERYVAGEMQAPRNAVATLLDTIHRGDAYFSPIYADDHPQLDVEYQRLKPVVVELGRLVVDEIDDEASDWENSVGSSEPMDMADIQVATEPNGT